MVSVSAMQQRASAIRIYIYPLPFEPASLDSPSFFFFFALYKIVLISVIMMNVVMILDF